VEDFVGAKFYCLRALAGDNQRIGIREKTLEFSIVLSILYDTIRYDTRCYFNVRSKADISQLNLPHGTEELYPYKDNKRTLQTHLTSRNSNAKNSTNSFPLAVGIAIFYCHKSYVLCTVCCVLVTIHVHCCFFYYMNYAFKRVYATL